MVRKLSEKIEVNRKEYELLLKDPNYMDVRFNPKNGGLSAIHKDHNFDPTIGLFKIARGDYERISLNVLYNYGNSVILGSAKAINPIYETQKVSVLKKYIILLMENCIN